MAATGKPTRLHCPQCGRFVGKVQGTYAELWCKRCRQWFAFKIKDENRTSVREAIA